MKNRKITLAGAVLTVTVTLAFIWAIFQWYNRYNWPPRLSIKDMQSNEIQAFKNLQLIVQAQKKYKQVDWDGDGEKTYAKFLVHLWTSVGTKSEPILIELISKKLGFAMGPSKATDGYYFLDLRNRVLLSWEVRRLDYKREWAIAGAPVTNGKTGLLFFLADQSGQIFVKNSRFIPSDYPDNPLSNGWKEVESVQKLQDFQRTIEYPVK